MEGLGWKREDNGRDSIYLTRNNKKKPFFFFSYIHACMHSPPLQKISFIRHSHVWHPIDAAQLAPDTTISYLSALRSSVSRLVFIHTPCLLNWERTPFALYKTILRLLPTFRQPHTDFLPDEQSV